MPDLSTILVAGAAEEPTGETDLISLVTGAHWVVLLVMAILAVMFLVGVYIIIYKTLYLRRAGRETVAFNDSFWRSRDIEQIYKQAQALRNSPVSQMFVAGYTELAKLAADERMKDDREGKLDNIERSLRKAQTNETTKLESAVPFLATTGASAPFIGLFGTVMGILITFQNMGGEKAKTIKELAPQIAEALLATGVGLVAAIPSVIAYNYFVRWIKVLRADMETFEQDYLNIIKRHFLH